MKSFCSEVKEEISKHLQKTISNTYDLRLKNIYTLRKTFLDCGYVNSPVKDIHLEFIFKNITDANKIIKVLIVFSISAKITVRNKIYIVYLSNKESIMLLLKVLGANKSLKKYDDIIKKNEIKSNINRKVNFEIANINKSANASAKQIQDIELLLKHKNINEIDENLRQLALIRLKNPDLTLKELSNKLGNISKSTINYRFKKIKELSNEYKKGE